MHVRCPHCHNPIDIVDDDPLTEVTCPSCGSNFSLISGEETISFHEAEAQTVGHFELIERIGVGHFGSVWKANDTTLQRTVAVKIPRNDQLSKAESEVFFREARAAAQLKHPNIVRVYEVGRQNDTIYIVSDYIDGANLKEWVANQRLSPKEVAELCVTIADGLQHAHEAGVIHRDLKPSNIMIDRQGNPYIVDFGLAKRETGEITMTVEGKVLGTPAYMPPEQARGEGHHADQRSDVYSLGVILFELLTGELPFRGGKRMLIMQILDDEPPSPRKLENSVPRDLETICLKCLEKEPARRFQTAGELAEDLKRYLNGEPIHARPVGRMERGWRWTRRHPARAGLLAVSLLALLSVVGIGVGVGYQQRLEEANNELQSSLLNEKSLSGKLQIAISKLQTSLKYELTAAQVAEVSERLQRMRSGQRETGWSRVGWDLARSGSTIRITDTLRDEAADTLIGLDVSKTYILKIPASSVAFNSIGNRLLIAGQHPADSDQPGPPITKLWEIGEDAAVDSKVGKPGLVTFGNSDVRLQLVFDRPQSSFSLLNVATGEQVQEFPLPDNLNLEIPDSFLPPMALTPDGEFIAASVPLKNDEGIVVIWNAETGETAHTIDWRATALRISPDGRLLSAGTADGQVGIWSLPDGRKLPGFSIGQPQIHALAFGKDSRRFLNDQGDTVSAWNLAVADAGGTITLWDLREQRLIGRCVGAIHQVLDVEFSPDGTILAAGGRGSVKIWDVARRKELLQLRGGNTVHDVAFSRDGRRLAACSGAVFGESGLVSVWDLEFGRGIRTLRGLNRFISKATFSRDGKWLAALSNNWQVGIWNVETGRLLHALQVEPGFTIDNAALAFDDSGDQFAFSAGEHASLWDTTSGRLVKRWNLPRGLQDQWGFHHSGQLRLFRYERDTQSCVVRELLAKDPMAPLATLSGIQYIYAAVGTADGEIFALDGIWQDGSKGERRIAAYDGSHGTKLWSVRSPNKDVSGYLSIDPSGKLLIYHLDHDQGISPLVDLRTGDQREVIHFPHVSLSPGAKFCASASTLLRVANEEKLITFGIGTPASFYDSRFSSDGKLLAWGNLDGTVYVCDIEEVRAKLDEIGLGW